MTEFVASWPFAVGGFILGAAAYLLVSAYIALFSSEEKGNHLPVGGSDEHSPSKRGAPPSPARPDAGRT